MENAAILLVNIIAMLVYAIPGYVLVKAKTIKPDHTVAFNALLLFIAQPCLVYYAMTKVTFSPRILKNMLITFLVSLVIMFCVMGIFFLFFRNHQKENIDLRISNIAIAFSNCTFMGVPLLEALLPQYPEASIYSVIFFLSMCLIGWTFACFIISRDTKYISIKKVLINPATISLAICMPFFYFGVAMPEPFHSAFTLLGKMSTPLCMIILGMRLATLPLKNIVLDPHKYGVIALRQFLVPLIYIFVCAALPIEPELKLSMVVCGSAPVASMVLNFAELLGEGQKYAAGTIIISNLTAVLSMPVMIMVMEFFLSF